MKSARLGQSSVSRSGLSGSNDDSSVVSLKALVAKVEPQSSAARTASFDDSGLIDLKKLMADASSSSRALPPVLAPSEAGLFAIPEPTLAPHVATTVSLSEETAENKSAGRGKWLAAAGVFVILAVAGTFGVLRSQTPATASSESTTTPVIEAATASHSPVETAPVAAVVDTTPAPTIAATTTPETRKDTTQPRPTRQASVNAAARDRAGHESPAVVKTKPEEKPATSPACDLRCEIERAAKKQKSK